MGVNEKLGIDIEINTDKVAAGLKAFQDLLSKSFGAADLSKLVEQMTKLEGVSAKATAGFRASAKDIKSFADAFTNGDLDAARKKMEELYDTRKMKQWSKEYHAELAMIMKQQEAGNAAALKGTELNIRAQKQLLDTQIASGNATLKTYSNSGYQPVNGGYVKSSVNTNLGMDDTHAAALRMNGNLAGTKKITDGLAISIGTMAARLTEFYSIRSGLFAIGSEFRTAFAGLISFNQELANTAAISNASVAQMDRLKEAALSVATSSKFSATEVMKSFKELAQAGVSAADLPSVGRTVDMFATGTGSTLDQATKVMTTSMNVWNIEAEKSGRISNVLTAALNASKLEVGQLSTAMNYLANQSALSGNSLENTTALIATMANQGIQASTIGTGVAQLMARLMAPTEKFRGLLKEFSISLEEISPRAHTFAEIIKTFETAAIPVERILGALEVRTGRTLASAIQAGSEKFELMEQRITNTNSAAVAYSKAMEGVQAQINVLRSEALTSLNTTLQNTGASFTDMKENLQDVIVGLRSAEGQFMLFTSAMALGLTAMTRAAMANPILAGLTVALAGVTWGVSKLGEANRETAKDIDAATKKSADQAGEYQRKSDGLFTMLSLVDKNKTSEEGYLVIQDKNVKGIRAVMNEFPQLFTGLDLKKMKYEQLTEIIKKYNLERGKELSNDITTGNQEADKINQLKTELAASVKYEADNENKGVFNFQQFTTAKLRDQLKLAEDSYAKMISANLAPRNDVEIFLDNQGTKRSRKVTPPPDQPRGEAVIVPDKVHTGKTPEERAESVLARLGEDQKDLAEKLRYQKAKIDRESAEVTLKDKTLSEEDYLIKEAAAIKLLDKEYADKQIADRTAAYSKLAKALGGAYTQPSSKNPTGHISFDKRFNPDAVNMLIDQTNKNLNYQTTTVDQAAKNKELERIRLMKPADPAGKLTSFTVEKASDRELTIKNQTLALSEKLIWSEQQLNQIQLDRSAAEIHNADEKRAAYESDLAFLGDRSKLEKDQLSMYDAIAGKLEAIKDKQIQLTATRKELEGGNNAAFTGGVRASILEKTDTNKLSAQLGSNMTSGVIDGLTSSLNGMVTALSSGGNAWKSFSDGLGKTMLNISQMLQEYVVRMMVVYTVQKLIGIAMAPAADAMTSGTTFSGGMQYNNGAYSGQSIYGAMATPYAEGGPVLNGVGGGQVPFAGYKAGVDSVPIYAMPGEFVIKKSVVDHFSPSYFAKLNSERFAEGGLIGGGSNLAASRGNADPAGKEIHLHLTNVVDPRDIPKVSAEEIINVISYSAQQRGTIHKVIKSVVAG